MTILSDSPLPDAEDVFRLTPQAAAALYKIGVALASGLEMDAVLRTILDQCHKVLPVDALYVALYHPEDYTYEVPLFWDQGIYRNLGTIDLRKQRSLTKVVIERGETLYLADMHDPPTAAAFPSLKVAEAPMRTYAGTPLLMRGEVIGVLSIQHLQPAAYAPEQIRLLEMIAAQAAVAVENAKLYTSANQELAERKRMEVELRQLNAELEMRVAQRTADLQSALEELRRAGRLKDEFMAMISHELRTPLMGVLSMASLLEEQIAGPLSQRQTTYVHSIHENGSRLLDVVNGILSYTQLIGGQVQLRIESFDLAYLLAVCAASQQHKATARQQSLQVVVEPRDLVLASDATALADVLKRLLDNAIKFTPQGGKIGLEAHPGPAHPIPSVSLVVWDTGVGIDREHLAHIVTPFTQADGRLARSHEGIGLGLAYVYEMVRQLGGRLDLESEPGHGSRFTLTLPAAAVSPPSLPQGPSPRMSRAAASHDT